MLAMKQSLIRFRYPACSATKVNRKTLFYPANFSWLFAATKFASVPAGNGPVPLIKGLNNVRVPVTTSSLKAQQYFNQGLALTYGFNHDGAIQSFRAAQALDPQCAMCFWGEAYAYGPNINSPMDSSANAKAVFAAERAMALRDKAKPWERDLIMAIALRYSNKEENRSALDIKYAAAMQRAVAAHPQNDDIWVLAAEAIMDTRPWDYWEADRRTPKGEIGTAVKMVEGVLSRKSEPPSSHPPIYPFDGIFETRKGRSGRRPVSQAPYAGGRSLSSHARASLSRAGALP